MAKVTFILEDQGDLVAMHVDFEGGDDKNSPAHKAAHMLIGAMNQIMEAPTMVHTAEMIRGQRADQVAHIKPESVIIHAH